LDASFGGPPSRQDYQFSYLDSGNLAPIASSLDIQLSCGRRVFSVNLADVGPKGRQTGPFLWPHVWGFPCPDGPYWLGSRRRKLHRVDATG